MAQINVNNLTFAYEGSFDNVFENTSFSIDTNWRLGFVGRNGKGKTTFLNLLLGKYEYEGNISTNTIFDYFPYIVNSEELTKTAGELIESWKPGVEIWRVMCELPVYRCRTFVQTFWYIKFWRKNEDNACNIILRRQRFPFDR